MEWVETAGRSVDEAKDAALDQLGVDESDAEFEIISEPRAGLFGRMRGEARVRARVRPMSPRPKRTRTRRAGQEVKAAQRSRGTRGTGRGGTGLVPVGEHPGPKAPGAGQLSATEVSETLVAENGSSARGKRRTSSSRRRRSRGGRAGASAEAGQTSGVASVKGRGGEQDTRRAPARSGRATSDVELQVAQTKEEVVGEDLSLEEQGEVAREFVEGLVRLLGLEASVSARAVDEDTAQVSVDGPGLGILIGPGGGTLGALQELARTVVQRHTSGRSERILVDVAGYRAKRAAALQRFTRQVAQEVLQGSAERALEPMSASDRKVVHDTVNEIEGVVTRSVGEEPRRYIVVAPATQPSAVDEDAGAAES